MAQERVKLEPVENDPAKNRRTAGIILLVVGVGAVLVMTDYLRNMRRQAESDRPPIVARLKSNFAAVRHDGETVAISGLEGKTWLATTVCLSQPGDTTETMRAMRWMADQLKDEERLALVCFTVDPENDRPAQLRAYAEELGVADDPRWWFLAAGEEKLRGYLKTQLRLGAVTEREKDGKPWLEFDPLITLVDPLLHLRQRYDFDHAREIEESAKRLMAEEPERIEQFVKDFKKHPEEFTDEVEKLEAKMRKDVDYVLNEELKEGTEL